MASRITLVVLGAFLCLGLPGRSQAAQTPTRAERLVTEVSQQIADLLWVKTDDYAHTGQEQKALALVRMVIQLDPAFPDAYSVLATYARNNEDAGRIYRAGLAANPNSHQLNFEYGFFYMALWTRNPKGGIPYLRKAVAAAPDTTQKIKYLHTLGHLYSQTDQVEQSIATWEEVLRLDPTDQVAQRELARLRASGAKN